jgi:hypothetical protein
LGFATPEEAARGDIAPEHVRVIGVVVRGDQAVVAQITNADGYPSAYEIDTAHVFRDDEGWSVGVSGNGDLAFIPTSSSAGTLVEWRAAPADATAARFVLGDHEATFEVEDGFVMAVFDDVPRSLWSHDYPRVTWISPDV